MKNAKKIVSLVLVIAFTLSLGYFATLTPTGAWLYDGAERTEDYTFGTFDVSTGQFVVNTDVTFDATTKFNDYIGETENKKASADAEIDFNNAHEFEEGSTDKIVYKKDVLVTNTGNVPARIYVSLDGGILNPENTEANSPKNELNVSYFFYDVEESDTSVRKAMEDNIVAFSGDTAVTAENRMSVLSDYQKHYVTIPASTDGEPVTMTLRVMFWADHDIVGATLDDTDNVKTLSTDARIILTAIQDTDGAIDSYYNSVKGTEETTA